jgi:hypothetical protein
MWLAPIVQLLALSAADPQAVGAPAAAAPALPAPIYWRETLFAIPFHIDRPARVAQEPTEVQLYVSGDRGARWDLYKKLPPTQQRFLFRAGCDGEYWFCVRTVDRSGRVSPQGPYTPGLRVIVDTTPPKLQLEARRGEGGQIAVRWQVDEANLKPESLSIQYRAGRMAPWQPVAVARNDIRTAGAQHTGELTWLAPAGDAALEIRGEAADRAGNPSISQAVLNANSASATSTPVGRAQDARASAGQNTGPIAPLAGTAATPATTDAVRPAETQRAANPGLAPRNWPAENTSPTNGPAADRAAASPSSPATPGPSSAGNPGDAQPAGPVSAGVNPAIRSQYLGPADKSGPSAANAPVSMVSMGTGVPDGERVRWVNSRSFELEYDAQSVGPTGVGRVELWGTRDAGRNWRSFGVDDKKRSPMVVTVDDEGIYGFRIAIQNGAGAGGKPPRSGELPEIWIGVDMTKPVGRIMAVEPIVAGEANKLTIAWEANDNQKLAPRPISLYFSETLGGPWTSIAAGLENTNRYTWQFDARAPQRVFLRLEVRDEAGNVGAHETTEPVSLDRTAPAARIRDVRPLGALSQPADSRYMR